MGICFSNKASLGQQLQDHQQQEQNTATPDLTTQAVEVEAAVDNLDLVNHARKPDGVDYLCACLRYRGHNIAITCLSRRNPDSFPRQGYDGLRVDRGVARPVGDENFQRGLTFGWIIPTGHWVAVSYCGLANSSHSRSVSLL